MTTFNTSHLITKEAAADLSAIQFYLVKCDSNGKAAAITSVVDIPMGVLQNKPETGEAASIAPIGSGGTSRVVLGATIAAGALVAPGGTGKAVADASGSYNAGLCLQGGVDGDVGEVLLANLTIKA